MIPNFKGLSFGFSLYTQLDMIVFQLIHISTRDHLNDYEGQTDFFVIGDVHNVIVKREDDDYPVGVLEKHEQLKRKRVRKNSVESSPVKRSRQESDNTTVDGNTTVEDDTINELVSLSHAVVCSCFLPVEHRY